MRVYNFFFYNFIHSYGTGISKDNNILCTVKIVQLGIIVYTSNFQSLIFFYFKHVKRTFYTQILF